MTSEQAIAILTEKYGAIETVKTDVFAARVDGNFLMFRLTDGVLEQRSEPDYHTCVWEAVE